MSCRNFAEVLKGAGVDINVEYASLYNLAYRGYGFCDYVSEHFSAVSFRGTAVDFEDFNNRYDFDFEEHERPFGLDYLLLFCEYLENLAHALVLDNPRLARDPDYPVVEIFEHLKKLVDKLHYRFVEGDDGLAVLVGEKPEIIAAAEVAPEEVAADLVYYDWRGLRGDLKKKRAILNRLAQSLEPRRNELEKLSKGLCSDFFFLVNNLNVRHDNATPNGSSKYKPAVAEMGDGELEKWYDRARDMAAAAFLLLSYGESAPEFDALKKRISSND